MDGRGAIVAALCGVLTVDAAVVAARFERAAGVDRSADIALAVVVALGGAAATATALAATVNPRRGRRVLCAALGIPFALFTLLVALLSLADGDLGGAWRAAACVAVIVVCVMNLIRSAAHESGPR